MSECAHIDGWGECGTAPPSGSGQTRIAPARVGSTNGTCSEAPAHAGAAGGHTVAPPSEYVSIHKGVGSQRRASYRAAHGQDTAALASARPGERLPVHQSTRSAIDSHHRGARLAAACNARAHANGARMRACTHARPLPMCPRGMDGAASRSTRATCSSLRGRRSATVPDRRWPSEVADRRRPTVVPDGTGRAVARTRAAHRARSRGGAGRGSPA